MSAAEGHAKALSRLLLDAVQDGYECIGGPVAIHMTEADEALTYWLMDHRHDALALLDRLEAAERELDDERKRLASYRHRAEGEIAELQERAAMVEPLERRLAAARTTLGFAAPLAAAAARLAEVLPNVLAHFAEQPLRSRPDINAAAREFLDCVAAYRSAAPGAPGAREKHDG